MEYIFQNVDFSSLANKDGELGFTLVSRQVLTFTF